MNRILKIYPYKLKNQILLKSASQFFWVGNMAIHSRIEAGLLVVLLLYRNLTTTLMRFCLHYLPLEQLPDARSGHAPPLQTRLIRMQITPSCPGFHRKHRSHRALQQVKGNSLCTIWPRCELAQVCWFEGSDSLCCLRAGGD